MVIRIWLHLLSACCCPRAPCVASCWTQLAVTASCWTKRYRDARHFLEASDLDLQTIAERLDFTTPANFTRAFRRWAGVTPSAFRRSRQLTGQVEL